jgi:hypothetical protein
MTPPLCACRRLIGPWRDGDIDTTQRALVEEHLARGCGGCQSEIRYLDWLVEELKVRTPQIDEVAMQRWRTPVIAQAGQQLRRWQTLSQQRLGALKGAVAAAAAIGLGLVLFDRSPRVNVARISGKGEVRRFTEGERSVVQLGDGRYELQVSRGILDRSLLVRLPDGEIEDIGTAFGVTVQGGRTSHVAVSEGVVQLRLHGSPDLTLQAGSAWKSSYEPLQNAAPVTEARPLDANTAAAQPPSAAHPGAPTKHRPHVHPKNNTEDAMYLRMLDLLRAERRDAARGLAQRYLQEFPDGFRRTEVLRISQSKNLMD